MSVYTVLNNNNSGVGSFRAALNAANADPGSTIVFDAGVTGTITIGPTVLPDIVASVTINGPGPSVLTISNSAVANGRIFNIPAPGSGTITVNISGLTLSDAIQTGAPGGAVFIGNNVTANLTNLVITGNAADRGGGIFVAIGGTATIDASVISNNRAGVDFGGGILTRGTTTILNTTITENLSLNAGGGIYKDSGTIDIRYSTIYNNGVSLELPNAGVGIDNTGTANISNSTFTLNLNQDPQSSFYNSITHNSGTMTVINITVHNTTNNERVLALGGTINYGNTIIDTIVPTGGIFNGLGGNWVTDIQGNPLLGPLQNNGGPTLTIAPLTTPTPSPLIDGGFNVIVNSATDQRGFARISPPGGTVDIGAVEIVQEIICYSGESLVLAKNIQTGEISEITAKNIYAGIHEVYDITNKKFISVKHNIIANPTNRFMVIKQNSLGENLPNQDLFITSGHRILYKGEIVKARNIPGAKRIRVKPTTVYSICTNDKTVIRINGLDVFTWGHQEWLDYSHKHGIEWRDNKMDKKITNNEY